MSKNKWALILGGSSGLGLATAQKLAQHQFNCILIHRDRRSELAEIDKAFEGIKENGVLLKSYNIDATNVAKRAEIISDIKTWIGTDKIDVLVHSIAKGNLKPMFSTSEKTLVHQDFQLTLEAMAISVYDWTHGLLQQNLLAKDTRIIAFTSEGNTKAIPNYAAVSAAKVALEAIIRNMALEFAPIGIKANCIQAGVTETASFQMIPGSELIKENAINRNPNNRLTQPEDVANVVYLLTRDEARWITGTIVKVDGGESLR
tara:strand:+ start:133396 stop:134175 length:780 start_codon:yes stop_codon:yes gene_type:complete